MTVKDILRAKPAYRRGYTINTISTTSLNPVNEGFLRKLQTIPSKITAQLCREKIAAVYKTLFGGPDDTYYIVVASDGTFFHVDY
jgi:hypothetical protein